MTTFSELVDSRKTWINEVLRPWCRAACRPDLLLAESEWGDIAGRAAPEFTLWLWAWERFPVLCVDGLQGLEESFAVEVQMNSGSIHSGFPDSRRSRRGELFLIQESGDTTGPLRIDDIRTVTRRV